MFAQISSPYDGINRLFSLGIDVWWRRRLVRRVLQQNPQRVLDLATGSGDVALLLGKCGVEVCGLDFCLPMLQQAREKGCCGLAQGDGLQMPYADATFDALTVAFGFRNFSDYDRGLSEIKRVLKPGGWLYILEFTDPARWFRPLYYFYLCRVMPVLAGWISRHAPAYHYLAGTITRFPTAEDLAAQMQRHGLTEVAWDKLSCGIVAIHRARK